TDRVFAKELFKRLFQPGLSFFIDRVEKFENCCYDFATSSSIIGRGRASASAWTRLMGCCDREIRICHASQVEESFNTRSWNEAEECLYDVVDGEGGADASFGPNQEFAISLPHAVLRHERWESVLQAVRKRLLNRSG